MLLHKMAPALRALHLHRRQIQQKDKINLILGAIIILLGAVPEAFSKTDMIDAFVLISLPMPVWTYVYMICCGISWILAAIIILRCVNCSIKPFFRVFLAYTVYDFILFFVNYNSATYYYIPLILIALILNKLYAI